MINEITKESPENPDYWTTLLWTDDKGERHATQAMMPAELPEYMQDKSISKIEGLYVMGLRMPCDTREQLEMICRE